MAWYWPGILSQLLTSEHLSPSARGVRTVPVPWEPGRMKRGEMWPLPAWAPAVQGACRVLAGQGPPGSEALGLTGNQPHNTSSAGRADATTLRGDTASLPRSRTAVALQPLSRCPTCPLPECEGPREVGSWRIPARKLQGPRAPGTPKTLTNRVGDNAGPCEGWLRAVRSHPP